MGFLAPWFLAGVAAVGLPIWMHLLKRHKTDPRLFPSLMFFEQRETKLGEAPASGSYPAVRRCAR